MGVLSQAKIEIVIEIKFDSGEEREGGFKRVSSRRNTARLRTSFCSGCEEVLQPFDFRFPLRNRCQHFRLVI